ncbi:MAG: patatin-like phospholipase family protein [Sphingomicrobium sp.]
MNQDALGGAEHDLRSNDPNDFNIMMQRALTRAHAFRASSDDLLILSGGSQHGAFGAGFFEGMGETRAGVPNYTFVTAVSTGALVSTLVFLANEPIRGKRTYPSYMVGAAGVSNLKDLGAIFAVDKEGEIIHVWDSHPPLGVPIVGLQKGALATFAPLRSLIFGMLNNGTLEELQEAYNHGDGRHLLVGVTDLEDSAGYAIDLTQYVDDAMRDRVNPDIIRTCYIDALLASSSVPPGMPPISLTLYPAAHSDVTPRTSMFVDGGARFGVFWGQLVYKPLPELKNATVLMNGTFKAGPWDDFHKDGKWGLIRVAKRSSDILINQIYRFSVDQVRQQFSAAGKTLKFVYISNNGLEKYGGDVAKNPDLYPFRRSTCGGWRKYDEDNLHPLEFHPNYMQCLVEYGRVRGSQAPWNYP